MAVTTEPLSSGSQGGHLAKLAALSRACKMGMTVDITCLCGKSKCRVEVAAQALPVKTTLCHCNICRYTSGLLCVSYLTLEAPPELHVPLTIYQSSAKMIRQFCSVCGSHVFAYNSKLHKWYVATGVIETPDSDVVGRMVPTTEAIQHEFVSDTVDGGLAPCLVSLRGRQSTFFAQGPDQKSLAVDSNGQPKLPPIKTDLAEPPRPHPLCSEDRLRAGCHCGEVQFSVSRPNEQSVRLSSPWSDLLVRITLEALTMTKMKSGG